MSFAGQCLIRSVEVASEEFVIDAKVRSRNVIWVDKNRDGLPRILR